MDRWIIVAMLGFAGLGVLAFLRLVSNEVALRIRALHVRVKLEEEEAERARAEAGEASDVIHEAEAA
ncbi:MAG TPA: hypothetical protein P5572_08520 [Phycisphaerae bacterium]|nr:hypothetical protein [Phycisphaerales bacterium]HRX85047.1 hypothetical protein [Phycisphaerae bacterium]